MRKLTYSQVAAIVLSSALSFALTASLLAQVTMMIISLRAVAGGLVAWAGTFSLLFLGCGTIALIIALPAYYREGSRRGKLRHRLFRVLAIQFFLYPVLLLAWNIGFSFRFSSVWDVAMGGAGFALGILFAVLAVRTRHAVPPSKEHLAGQSD
jgi:hypothetical protein